MSYNVIKPGLMLAQRVGAQSVNLPATEDLYSVADYAVNGSRPIAVMRGQESQIPNH